MNKNGEPIVGVDTDRFDNDAWHGVAESYVRSAYRLADEEAVTPTSWYYMSAESAIEGFGEFRLGSIITMHSKLLVCSHRPDPFLHFNFHANADPRELEYAKIHVGVTEEMIQEDFQSRVATFLSGMGIARTVAECRY